MNKISKHSFDPFSCGRFRLKFNNVLKCLIFTIVAFSVPLFLYGYLMLEYNYAIIGVNLVFIVSVLYSYLNIRRRVIYLVFNICMWVFLISRPTISMIRGDVWWYFDDDCVKFALFSLYLTMLSLLVGGALCERILQDKGAYKGEHTRDFIIINKKQIDLDRSILIISGMLCLVCFVCKMAIGLEKIAFMSGKEYYEYYVSYESSFPYAFGTIASMMPYALCVFLASMPKKRYAYAYLIMYVASTLPNLLIGIRNDIVLALIFSFLYFYVRDYFDGTKYWVGKFERMACVIMIPIALVFLGAYNYIRDSAEYQSNAFSLITDLFYKQGVSFDVLCLGYAAIPILPNVVAKNYTFGAIIDYLRTNIVSRTLFDIEPFPSGNSEMRAIYGNEFAHSMSYVVRDDYLEGHGFGSSFILETYADFGFVGMIVFSVLIGMLTIYMLHLMKKSRMWRIVILLVLTQFFFMPRSSATGCFTFLLYIQFWVPVVVIMILAHLINKKNDIISYSNK